MLQIRSFCLLVLLFVCLVSAYPQQEPFYIDLVSAAVERTNFDVEYDASYYSIEFPNGDIPSNKGACTDVIIRAYRKLGIDLQSEVNQDMSDHFKLYPAIWGLKKPDPNIDHRRVSNLQVFFGRKGMTYDLSPDPDDYIPGDIVTWDLGGGIDHIGLISDQYNETGDRYLVVHNMGLGTVLQDILLKYQITGHYRYAKEIEH